MSGAAAPPSPGTFHNPDHDFRGAYVSLEAMLSLRVGPFTQPRSSRERSRSSGQRESHLRGRGIDFAEVRAYQPGDDVRTIDWRVTARKNKPHTKVFREERERPTLIYVDQTRSLFFGSRRRLKSVAAAELAARLAWRCLDAGDRVGGLVSGTSGSSSQKPLHNARAVARFLAEVAEHNQALSRDAAVTPSARLESDLLRLRHLARSQHRVYLISDFLPAAAFWTANLQALAARNDVAVAHIVDPLEALLPIRDRFVVTDGRQRLTFDGQSARARNDYADRFAQHCEQLADQCRRLGVPYRQISTDEQIDLNRMHF
ncbi:MAG: DUF58 domain-containing protein [Pseudomonadota bacterium]